MSIVNDFDPDNDGVDGHPFGVPHGTEESWFHAICVPFEATASYHKGTAEGPEAILRESDQVDLFDARWGEPWRAGIAVRAYGEVAKLWNQAGNDAVQATLDGQDKTAEVDALGERVNAYVGEQVAEIFSEGRVPVVVGGDHSVPYAAMAEAARRHPGMGVLHIDAHADLRKAYQGFRWSHASIFYNVIQDTDATLLQIGIRDQGRSERQFAVEHPRIAQLLDDEIAQVALRGGDVLALFEDAIAKLPQQVWLSVDIDGLRPDLCPSTGTPVPGGLDWREFRGILDALVRSGRKVIGFDLCEVGSDNWDGAVGARVLYNLLGAAAASRGLTEPFSGLE